MTNEGSLYIFESRLLGVDCRSWSRRGFKCRRSASWFPGNKTPCEKPPAPVSSVRIPEDLWQKKVRVSRKALCTVHVSFFFYYYVLFFFCTITPLVIKKVSQCEHFLFWRVSIEQISKRGAKKINKNSIFHAFCIFARCDDYFTNCWILKSNEKSCTTHPPTFFLLRCSYLWH